MTGKKSRIAIGLDIGSLFVKLVILENNKRPIRFKSIAHQGNIFQATRSLALENRQYFQSSSICLIGKHAGQIAKFMGIQPESQTSAIIHVIRQQFNDIRQIIDIGATSLSLIELDESGTLINYQTNTLCAAGTGSFLDEQAVRLGIDLTGSSTIPFVENPPQMATRCAVFAKSDLIHRQQEGCSTLEMWSGICKSIAGTIIATLFKGRKPLGRTVVIGGVARNNNMMKWLGRQFDKGMMVSADHPQETGAWGAALMAEPMEGFIDWNQCIQVSTGKMKQRRPPLMLQRSQYPSFCVETAYVDNYQNEIRITKWPEQRKLKGFIGIDVGSTSTKLLMINQNEEVILDIYRKTDGNPIKATKHLLRTLQHLVTDKNCSIEILGAGTTGSGRKLIGSIIKADSIINEITAHLKGAMKIDPKIDTIFEIGGQDSKYIHAVNGTLHNANMNYVCAAGTGSFIEEVSKKTGIDLQSMGDKVIGVEAPITSDRCTVFMDQDISNLLRQGYTPREVAGGILYSVAQNYLTKVVGNRYYSRKKIFFQGATARNKGLVAVFENLLDVEIVVSEYCHAMGSLGAALMAKHKIEKEKVATRFTGLYFSEQNTKVRSETCNLCSNHCRITIANIGHGKKVQSWGYLCGRAPHDKQAKKNKGFRFFKQREYLWKTIGGENRLPDNAPVIYYPRALLSFSHYPFWRSFFSGLGYRLVLSKKTDHQIHQLATDWVGGDYCHPVKLAHGHTRYLLETKKEDFIFIPSSISDESEQKKTSQSFFCPYNMALPALISSATQINGQDETRLLIATIDFRWDAKTAVNRLTVELGEKLKKSKKDISRAFGAALKIKKRFEQTISAAGKQALGESYLLKKPAVVILGRPYNIFDSGANLALPEKLANLGFTVLPLDFLNLEAVDIGKEFYNMYWNFGKKILEAARIIACTPNLYAVYLNNFGCGPDSFIQTYVEKIMGNKPMLMLELDGHGADVGYMTRIEAFADVLAVNKIKQVPRYTINRPEPFLDSIENKTLWFPPMGEPHPRFAAAVFQNAGQKAKALPNEKPHSFLAGRALTRGGECAPCPATLGTFISTIREKKSNPEKQALFMPTATGPCRFGQYSLLDRIALNKIGWEQVSIVSLTSENSYQFKDKKLRMKIWLSIIIADILFKMRCRIKPYEKNIGQTEEVYHKNINRLVDSFKNGANIKHRIRAVREDFLSIPTAKIWKPLVGIVGEIYVRNNRFINNDLVRKIENAGGEAWLTPISEWIQYITFMESLHKRNTNDETLYKINNFFQYQYLHRHELYWTRQVNPILNDRLEPNIKKTVEEGSKFLPIDFSGEAIITLGRAIQFLENGADLVVNCAPFGCMPGTITSGIFEAIQKQVASPVVNLFFDGEDNDTQILDVYLANLNKIRPN